MGLTLGQRLKVAQLERRVAARRREVRQLLSEYSRLLREHRGLVDCCDGLELLRLQQCSEAGECDGDGGSGTNGAAAAAAAACDRGLASAGECELLDQLSRIQYDGRTAANLGAASSGAAAAAAAAATADDATTISPPSDAMRLFRHVLVQPPLPEAEPSTVAALAARYARTVQGLALHLAQLHTPPGMQTWGGGPPLQGIKQLILEHLERLASLVLHHHRHALVNEFMLTNACTMERIEEADLPRHRWVLQQLILSPKQATRIVEGMRLFGRLLAPIIAERAELQTAVALLGGGGPDGPERLSQRAQQLARLAMLLRKEYYTRVAAAAWIVGAMTWEQAARAMVLMAPYPPWLAMFGKLLLLEDAERGVDSGFSGSSSEGDGKGGSKQ